MELLLIFVVGFTVSFVSSLMTGVLGMLSIMGLLALGLPPHVALGTFRLGSLGFGLGGLIQYFKANKIVWELVVPMIFLGVVGSVIGAHIILAIDEDIIRKVVGFVILIFIPLTLWKPHIGLERKVVSAKRKLMGYISFFFASIWGGSITVGTGFLVVYSQIHFFRLTILEIKGTNRIPNLIKTSASLGIFAYYSLVDWRVGIVFAIGMLFGSYIGTHYALKIGDVWIRNILLVSVGLFSVKLILGL